MTYGLTSKSSTRCRSAMMLAVRLAVDEGAEGAAGAVVADGAIERGGSVQGKENRRCGLLVTNDAVC